MESKNFLINFYEPFRDYLKKHIDNNISLNIKYVPERLDNDNGNGIIEIEMKKSYKDDFYKDVLFMISHKHNLYYNYFTISDPNCEDEDYSRCFRFDNNTPLIIMIKYIFNAIMLEFNTVEYYNDEGDYLEHDDTELLEYND